MIPRFPLIYTLFALLLTLAWSGWLGYRHIQGTASVLDRAEYMLMDLRITATSPPPPPNDVVIIAIDDETVVQAGGFPIDRTHLAELVRLVSAAGAKALALDLLLLDATEAEADAALANAFTSLPTVLAGAARFSPDSAPIGPVPNPASLLLPRAQFLKTAQVGLVNIVTDVGGTPRHLPLVFQTQSSVSPSLALQAVTLFSDERVTLSSQALKFASVELPLDHGWHLPLRYFGPQGTLKTISAKRMLFDGAEVNLTGKLAVIGATATGIGDRFNTPFDPIMPGVEVLATGVSNILGASALVRDQNVRRIDAATGVILAIVSTLAIATLPLALASGLVLITLTGWIIALVFLFGQGYWFNVALPLASIFPPAGIMLLARQVFDRRQTRLQTIARNELGRFHAPLLIDAIAENPDFLSKPREQVVPILFVDLSGYTGLSERLGPSETRNILKAFHSLVVEVGAKHSGIVLDFMGDGAMIGFGIPHPGDQDIPNAVQTAFDLAAETKNWIRQAGLESELKGLRIGLHSGPIVLSRLGHENHQQIAATGDSVNVAARLMDAAKDKDATLAISTSTYDASLKSGKGFPVPDLVEMMEIRGRNALISVSFWRSDTP